MLVKAQVSLKDTTLYSSEKSSQKRFEPRFVQERRPLRRCIQTKNKHEAIVFPNDRNGQQSIPQLICGITPQLG